MIDRGVELRDVVFQAITGVLAVPHELPEPVGPGVQAFSGNCGVEVVDERFVPDGLQDVHRGMVDDPVRIVGEFEDGPGLWFVDLFCSVWGGRERVVPESVVQLPEVALRIAINHPHIRVVGFAPPGVLMGQVEVVNVNDFPEQVSVPFHGF